MKYTVSTSLDAKTEIKKKSEVSPDIQHSVGFTGGTLNELENGVKCAKGLALPKTACIFLFELWSILYYFSALILEFWKQFKIMHP